MASQRSEKCKYISGFAEPGETIYCTGAAYLAEKMVARQAARDKEYLPPKFWNKKPSALKEFKKQTKQASDLIKELESKGVENPVEIIIKAVNHRRCAKVFSLGLKSVILDVCLDIWKQQQAAPPPIQVETVVDTTQKPRPQIGSKNIISKLRDLE